MGYRTLIASTGRQAMAVAKAHKGKIDLLLSDVTMPGMTGPQVAAALTALRPSLKVILMTGGSRAGIVLRKGWKLLQKPFTPQMIKDELEQTLKSADSFGPTQP